jgi:HAD superfamily hydrolase (TIGR01509 family)
MDGTLIDSEPLHLLAYQRLLEPFQISWTEHDNHEFLGRTDLDVCRAMVSKFNLALSARQLVERKEEILRELLSVSAEPRQGVLALLQQAKALRIPIGLASSATMATIEFTVAALHIRSYFATLTSGEEVERGKPDPSVFLLCSSRLQVAPADCLVVEDTLNGIKAAKAAGMHCLVVPCDATRHEDHSLADARLESLSDFDLARWFNSGVLSV